MTKEIPIRNKPGMFALVDDEDYPLVSRYSWTLGGQKHHPYAMTNMEMSNGNRCVIYLHRFIMGGFGILDHKDNNYLDCRKDNLRRATKTQNEWNKAKQKTMNGKPCTSKYKGVCFVHGRWLAQIKRNGMHYNLGTFKNEEDAARAYNKKAAELSGDFVWLNSIPEEAA